MLSVIAVWQSHCGRTSAHFVFSAPRLPMARPGAVRSNYLGRVGGHMRLHDLVGILHRLAALDLVAILHAGRDLAPDGVLAVEEGRVIKADEELAVAGIRTGGTCHRRRATDMRLLVELGLELLARTPGAGALRTTGLRHEALDHAMEDDAILKTFTHQLLDARDVTGREVWPHFNGDASLRGIQDQSIFGDSHALFSTGWGGDFRVRNCTANGRPATAPAIPSVNGIGVQRCNASMTATR